MTNAPATPEPAPTSSGITASSFAATLDAFAAMLDTVPELPRRTKVRKLLVQGLAELRGLRKQLAAYAAEAPAGAVAAYSPRLMLLLDDAHALTVGLEFLAGTRRCKAHPTGCGSDARAFACARAFVGEAAHARIASASASASASPLLPTLAILAEPTTTNANANDDEEEKP